MENLLSSVAFLMQQVENCATVDEIEARNVLLASPEVRTLTKMIESLEAEQLKIGRSMSQIQKEMSDAKQKPDTTGFTAVQDILEKLEAEQQKVGDGLDTLRNETAQLAHSVGANVTQIKEELSIVKHDTYTSFAGVQANLGNLKEIREDLAAIKNECTFLSQYLPVSCSEIAETVPNSPPGFYQLSTPNGSITTKYCFAQNCSEIAARDPFIPSGYYQLRSANGTFTTKYCFPHSCSELREKHPSSLPGYYRLRAPNGSIAIEYCFPRSCLEKIERDPSSPPGYYELRSPNGTISTEYCPMDCKKCLASGSTGGWRRVAYLNMADPTHQCPSGFTLFREPRRCSPSTENFFGCQSLTYPMRGIQYKRVCGRVTAYQKGLSMAFHGGSKSIDAHYVDGVSLTHGAPPRRQHIWTFAAALDEQNADRNGCPCSNTGEFYAGHVPNYVKDNYFCDSGNRAWSPFDGGDYDRLYTKDPLWDGSGCGPTSSCCSFNSPPWFCKELSQPTADDIELRVCRSNYYFYVDVQIELIELYTQ